MIAEVGVDTLTPRWYSKLDAEGKMRFTMNLDRYHDQEGVIWPRRIVARSDQGTIRIDMRELEFNAELPEAAFTPPRRAEKLP